MSGVDVSAGWKPLKAVGLMGALGPLLAKRDNEQWRYGLVTDSRHANAIGVIHGGTLCTLCDHVMSLVAWEAVERQPVVTVHMDTTFIALASPGDFLEAETRIAGRKGSMVFLEAVITRAGDEVMKASSIMKVIEPRQREKQHGP